MCRVCWLFLGLVILLAGCAMATGQSPIRSVADYRGGRVVPDHPLKGELEAVLSDLLRVSGETQGSVRIVVVNPGWGQAMAASAEIREIAVPKSLLDRVSKLNGVRRRMVWANALGHELAHIVRGDRGHYRDQEVFRRSELEEAELDADRLAIQWSRAAGYGCAWLVVNRRSGFEKPGTLNVVSGTAWDDPDLRRRAYEQARALCPEAPGEPLPEEAGPPEGVTCPQGAVWTGRGCLAKE
jgi:hypothetical protein